MVQDSTERFHTKSLQETQARRTARSAYNKAHIKQTKLGPPYALWAHAPIGPYPVRRYGA